MSNLKTCRWVSRGILFGRPEEYVHVWPPEMKRKPMLAQLGNSKHKFWVSGPCSYELFRVTQFKKLFGISVKPGQCLQVEFLGAKVVVSKTRESDDD